MEFNTLTLQYPCLCLCIKRDDLSICLDISEKMDYHTFKVLILLDVPRCAIWRHWCLRWNKKHNISQQASIHCTKINAIKWPAIYDWHFIYYTYMYQAIYSENLTVLCAGDIVYSWNISLPLGIFLEVPMYFLKRYQTSIQHVCCTLM